MWSATFGWHPRHRSASSEPSLNAAPCSGWRTRPVRELLKQGARFSCGLTFERRLKALLPETWPGTRYDLRRPGDLNNASLEIGSIENNLERRSNTTSPVASPT